MKILTTFFTTGLTLFLTVFSGIQSIQAQDENLKYEDEIYLDNIKSVRIYNAADVLSEPIVRLNSGEQIFLTFDDMDGEFKTYTYTIVHCDADWNPSELETMDYIDGFADQEIEEFDFSLNTYVPFVHYNLALPNDDMNWLLSGNYLLKVYEDEDYKKLALTRRFMVVDQQVAIEGELKYPADVAKFRTHHELDFSIDHKNFRIQNRQRDIKIVVRQNRRWDTAMKDLKPVFQRQDKLVYDFQDVVVFPAGKEYRWMDFRTLDRKSGGIAAIESFSDGYIVTVAPDEKRSHDVFFHNTDINGNYVIQNLDRTPGNFALSNRGGTNRSVQEILANRQRAEYSAKTNNLESDYADVRFSLDSSMPIYDAEVYVFGALSDWKIKDEFKMTYSTVNQAYGTEVLLKQGYYEYVYVVVREGSDEIDLEELEGNWHETENEYSILVYYSPVSSRYDQLIAFGVYSSMGE